MASCFVFPVAREKWTSFTWTLFWDVGVCAFSFWHFHEFDLWVFLVAGLLQKDSAFPRIECLCPDGFYCRLQLQFVLVSEVVLLVASFMDFPTKQSSRHLCLISSVVKALNQSVQVSTWWRYALYFFQYLYNCEVGALSILYSTGSWGFVVWQFSLFLNGQRLVVQ